MSEVVVAVDLGTSRSAWAYSLPSKAHEDIVLRVPQGSESCSMVSMKTETAVLLTSDGEEVVAFGHAARKRFITEAEVAESECVTLGDSSLSAANMLFRFFKMHLCEKRGYQSVNEPVAKADGGQELPLLKVIAAALQHFKEDVTAYLSELLDARFAVDRVKWVLTIPAIFDDFAKGFMRHAAFRAGMIETIDSSRLVLCLEPEAACLAVNVIESPDIVEPGSKAMILDCGGGTVDITTHEVLSTTPLSLKEILAPTGGPWGSACVDDAFKEWLRVFLGDENYKRVQHTSAFFSLLKQWEDGKTGFRGEKDDRVRLNFVEIATVLDDMRHEQLQDLCSNYYHTHQESVSDSGVRRIKFIISLSSDLVKSFFSSTISSIAECLQKLKRNSALRDLKHVFLVGGFSSSPLIQNVARDVLVDGECKVVSILRPDVAIVRGAVLFGSRPEVFRTRKARLTYGVRSCMKCDMRNPEHVKRREKPPIIGETGREYICFFSVHINVGDDISADGVCPASTYRPLLSTHNQICLDILASHERDVKFLDTDRCFVVGSVTVPVDLRVPFHVRGVKVQFTFGGTELLVTCFSKHTGEKIGQTTVNLVQEVQQG